MFKKHMTPLTKGGQTQVHQGKGSQMSGMPDRNQIKGLEANPSINNYAKATPSPMPSPAPMPMGPSTGSGPFG